jgi:hypothetical protein
LTDFAVYLKMPFICLCYAAWDSRIVGELQSGRTEAKHVMSYFEVSVLAFKEK